MTTPKKPAATPPVDDAPPAPPSEEAAVVHEIPTEGGCYVRHPDDGTLTRVAHTKPAKIGAADSASTEAQEG